MDELITMHCKDCPWEQTANPLVPFQVVAVAAIHQMGKGKGHEIVMGAR
jgi:hypothetical protein